MSDRHRTETDEGTTVSSQAEEEFDARFAAAVSRFVTGPVGPDSRLAGLGLDSLSLLRIIVSVVEDDDEEIDPGRLGDLETVADLRGWLLELHQRSTDSVAAS